MLRPVDLLGKRFTEGTDLKPKVRRRRRAHLTGVIPDFTVISVDESRNDCYVHAHGGGRCHFQLDAVMNCIKRGWIIESDKAPFTHSFRVGGRDDARGA